MAYYRIETDKRQIMTYAAAVIKMKREGRKLNERSHVELDSWRVCIKTKI